MFEGDGPFRGFSEAVIIDVETTGLDPKKDRIVSIGAVRVDFRRFIAHSGDEVKTYYCTVNPERRIPAAASAVHGITDVDVAGEERFANIIDGLRDFVGCRPLIAHNCSFDRSFIDAECRRATKPRLTTTGWYCTMERMCYYERTRGNVRSRISLQEAAELMCVPGRASACHNALQDALITMQLAAGIYMLDNKLEKGCQRSSTAAQNFAQSSMAITTSSRSGFLSPSETGSPQKSTRGFNIMNIVARCLSWLAIAR
ncbi:3'-5' exonuclease [Mesorhizobium sp.]|uniref:3'-5' exonuclease n=1 Tax=Mesorhizobium sp. TaxID=1871066 RepID=UPI001210FDBF|nr:3'-5' exonuclease [Mesorhizobium sp.]TIP10584.1 MAG: 3'-5' exonuclease [Mesorhizobium sp.]